MLQNRHKIGYQKWFFLIMLMISTNLVEAKISHSLNLENNTNTCDYIEGDIVFSSSSLNDTLVYQTQYYLTDTSDIILQVSNQSKFLGVTTGDYHIYALAYEINEPITGNYPGSPITSVLSKCATLSNKLPICVCSSPSTQRFIKGRIFRDTNEDGLDNDNSTNLEDIQVHIYEDINQNGQVDLTDSLLSTSITNTSGHYSYLVDETVIGRFISHFVIETDTISIPNDFYLTTDNIETVVFALIDSMDVGNDFGLSHTIDIKNEMWLDLNGNSIQEFTEVPLANMDICIANLSPLLINGINYPPNAFMDTITTDTNGIFIFENLPDCNWQFVVHYDSMRYIPTYDADGGILNITNFTTIDGKIDGYNNDWCNKKDCSGDLDYGFRLAGEFSLSGQICIDDLTKDGSCNTGTETYLNELVVNIFDKKGKKLGGVITSQNGAYEFPNLFPDNYLVDLSKAQNSLDNYILVTTEQSNQAIAVLTTKYSMFQKVEVVQNIGGIDFALILHVKTISAKDDFVNLCPNLNFGNNVSVNDSIENLLVKYEVITFPQYGHVQMSITGVYQYENTIPHCQIDQFTYEVCDLVSGDCDEATVYFSFQDTLPPTLINLPQDFTIHCNESIPIPPLVSAFDNCPSLQIDIEELSTQGEDGCSLYDYQLSRTWIATDACGNTNAHTQTITVEDNEAPGIFRIYTLPNETNMVAGFTRLTPGRWKTIQLPIKFNTNPLIFNQIITNQIEAPCIVQTRKISKSQFEMRIKQLTDSIDNTKYEEISWIAIEKGEDSLSQIGIFDLATQTENVTLPIGSNDKHVFTAQQTTNNETATFISLANEDTMAKIALVEWSQETNVPSTISEKVGYWELPKQALIYNHTNEVIGETGTMVIQQEYVTLSLQNSYYNPIIIATTNQAPEEVPVVLRMSQVSEKSWKIKAQSVANTSLEKDLLISYLVIEGSLPLNPEVLFCESGTDGLILGKDIKALDNCDKVVDLSYQEVFQQEGLVKTTKRIWQSSDECGNQVSYEQNIECEGVGVRIKTYLQGALIGSKEPGLMRDDLRRKGLIPIEDPYHDSPRFNQYLSDKKQRVDSERLKVTGANAVVDWIYVDLRKADNINEVVAANVGLLLRNGNVVSTSGDSILIFENINFDDYYVGVHHRNHLSVLTQEPQTFDLDLIPAIDFKNIFTPVIGGHSTVKINRQNAQWSGDVNGDGKVIFQGPNNDPFYIFLEILLDNKNTHFLTNFISRGYSDIDFNMDGIVIFQGPNNDRSNILYNTILIHPQNERLLTNFVINTANGN